MRALAPIRLDDLQSGNFTESPNIIKSRDSLFGGRVIIERRQRSRVKLVGAFVRASYLRMRTSNASEFTV